MRIALMVIRLFFQVPYYLFQVWWCGVSKKISYDEAFWLIKKVTKKANHAGRVKIEDYGLENLPEKNGFILFPNHQGMFDVLVFLESCPRPFSFVAKKEVSNIILLKQVIKALGAYAMDREDIRQSMKVINAMAEDVRAGRNFLIFPEGTRSKMGNKLLEFKGGSFKSATKAKCPIVPCALIDSFKPFDENSIQLVTVKLIYLPPIYYEEYKDMKTVDIAAEVKHRIEATIENYNCENYNFKK
ncbi:lysophospholipid acyltransferase family protein [Parablautia muri]|uniref:1-acyl-sn-glycerol-3-phosphate acyltransferase n=1 Tax=Parablautia muri TaxID=2320879 RepID=A0A9X5GTN1_9FIRM|nr:lysophospholipid acyltransferase family protein [Parablautia muri]NBJ94181.1 1-acyl-sn-glycerol-3-phosphate acyltransferase [Parablautia muri]